MPVCGGWASCVAPWCVAKTSVRPLALRPFSLANLASSPPFSSRSPFLQKENRPTSSYCGGCSRLRYWLCPLQSAHVLGAGFLASTALGYGSPFPSHARYSFPERSASPKWHIFAVTWSLLGGH